jgi:hypothetical protein
MNAHGTEFKRTIKLNKLLALTTLELASLYLSTCVVRCRSKFAF